MRKHSTWLWSIIIVVVVFAFVIWGTNPGSQGGGPSGIYGRINGKPVTEEAVYAARKEVNLRYFLRYGEFPGAEAERAGFDIQREVFYLLLLSQELEARKMYAGAEAKATVAANILRGLQSEGINTLADFEKALLEPRGMTLVDLDRFMEHQIALSQLTAVEGLSGQFVTPQQVESLWRRENQEISAQAVFFSSSNFFNSVEAPPEAVGAFFTNQMARYRIPEQLQVDYVAYPISNYFAQADERLASLTNLSAQVEELYLQRGTNFYADVTPEEAKEQIRGEVRRQFAVFAARQDAARFADELWQQEPMKPSDMATIGAEKGLTVGVTQPFERTGTPKGLDVNSAFTQAAYALREDEPYGGPIEGDEHVYVITINQRIPSANAALEDVKGRVTDDYKLQQATLKAREMGQTFASELADGLSSAKPFTELCTTAGYRPVLLPPFARTTRSLPEVEDHTALGLFKQVAFATPVGDASSFNYTQDGGYVLYVGSQLPTDEVRMKEELPRYAQVVRQTLESEAFGAWFNETAQVGLRETPLNQTPPPQVSAPGS